MSVDLTLITGVPRDNSRSLGMTNDQLLDEFFIWQAGRSIAPKSIKRRRMSLGQFVRHIAPGHLAEASFEDVERWLATKNTPNTKKAYRADLIVFYDWARRRRHVAEDPMDLVDSIRVPKVLPRPFRPDQVMTAVTQGRPVLRKMCALGGFAGLRCEEIATIDGSDIATHTKMPLLTVRNGKGGNDRIIPVHPLLLQTLGKVPSSGRLFPGLDGEKVGIRVKRHLGSLGIEGVAHQLRHTFGTQAAEAANGNMVLVQYLMGHASIQTTMQYVGWSGGPAADVVRAMFLVEQHHDTLPTSVHPEAA